MHQAWVGQWWWCCGETSFYMLSGVVHSSLHLYWLSPLGDLDDSSLETSFKGLLWLWYDRVCQCPCRPLASVYGLPGWNLQWISLNLWTTKSLWTVCVVLRVECLKCKFCCCSWSFILFWLLLYLFSDPFNSGSFILYSKTWNNICPLIDGNLYGVRCDTYTASVLVYPACHTEHQRLDNGLSSYMLGQSCNRSWNGNICCSSHKCMQHWRTCRLLLGKPLNSASCLCPDGILLQQSYGF